MSSIKLNSSHDIDIVNNKIVLVEDIEEKSQILIQNLKFFLGEWFLDNTAGIPYYRDVLKKKIEPSKVSSAFKNAILSSQGVIELVAFSLDLDTQRKLRLDFTVRFSEGKVSFSEVIG